MNQLLSTPLDNEKKSKAKILVTVVMLLFCALPVLLNTVLITPLYVALGSNVAFADTLIPQIMKYITDFFDLVAFSVSYALIIFSVLLLSKKEARAVIIIYTIIFALQIPIKIFMNIPLYGTLGSATDIILDLIYLLFYFGMYMLQLLLVYIFSVTDSEKYLRRVAFANTKKSAKKKVKDIEQNESFNVLPLTRVISFSNPLQLSAFKMGAVIIAVKLLSRILNDISIGAPTSLGEVLLMIAYYLSDLIYGVIAYFIALLIFNVLYDRLEQKKDKKTEEDTSPSALDI